MSGDGQVRPTKEGPARVLLNFWCWRRRAIALQLLGTVIVLGWAPGNSVKLALMVVIWAIGFGQLSLAELVAVGLVNLLFVLMDEAALRQGIFLFRNPDVIGLPIYEFFMWGFYILNAVRFIDGPVAHPHRMKLAVGLAIVFSLCFSLFTDPMLLAATAFAVLAAGLIPFHKPMDLAFTAYLVAVGTLVEYVGVGTGQWSYPHAPAGGVPLWSFAMWGGIGLFSRRLLVPFLHR